MTQPKTKRQQTLIDQRRKWNTLGTIITISKSYAHSFVYARTHANATKISTP